MDPARVPPEVRASAKPGTVLVSFMGDATYNWLKPDCLRPFVGPHFEEHRLQKTKSKARACTALAVSAYTVDFFLRGPGYSACLSTMHEGLHDQPADGPLNKLHECM